MEKKKFVVTETRPTMQTWTFYVEAENEEEALDMVQNGDVEPDDYSTEEESDAVSEYEIEEDNE